MNPKQKKINLKVIEIIDIQGDSLSLQSVTDDRQTWCCAPMKCPQLETSLVTLMRHYHLELSQLHTVFNITGPYITVAKNKAICVISGSVWQLPRVTATVQSQRLHVFPVAVIHQRCPRERTRAKTCTNTHARQIYWGIVLRSVSRRFTPDTRRKFVWSIVRNGRSRNPTDSSVRARSLGMATDCRVETSPERRRTLELRRLMVQKNHELD